MTVGAASVLDGRVVELGAGQSDGVGSVQETHRSSTASGAALLVIH